MTETLFHCARCLVALSDDFMCLNNEPSCPDCHAPLDAEGCVISPEAAAKRIEEVNELWDAAVRDGLITP